MMGEAHFVSKHFSSLSLNTANREVLDAGREDIISSGTERQQAR
jgi:hypothetical protein